MQNESWRKNSPEYNGVHQNNKGVEGKEKFLSAPFLFSGENVQVDQVNMFCASYVEEEETNMKKNLLGKMMITGIISAAMLAEMTYRCFSAQEHIP